MNFLSTCKWGVLLALLTAGPSSRSSQVESASSSNTAEAHVGKGYTLVQDRMYEQAVREFQSALVLDPTLVRARFQLAVCYFALQHYKEARGEFERLDRETESAPAVLYYLGRLDLNDDNPQEAVSRLNKITKEPPYPDALFYLGTAYLKNGNLQAAERWLKAAAEQAPRDFRISERLARVYLKAGRRAEAEQQFNNSSSLRQRYNEAARQGVDCVQALKTQPLDQARLICQQLFDSSDPDKLLTLGMIYGQQNFPAEAIEPFERAVRLDPESFEAQHNLGLTYFRLKRYAEARRPLERAVDLRPDYFGSNALLGATLFALKEDASALAVLEHAHSLNPEDADTSNLLFKVLMINAQKTFAERDYQNCLGHLQKAAQLHPDESMVHLRLANVYSLLGQQSMAEHEKNLAEGHESK